MVTISEKVITYKEALLRSMDDALANFPGVVIMGQGVDDHKGTFGSTINLAGKYGKDRVFDIPLSEEGNAGVAIGAALNGLYPIQTHIRNDFSLLASNQLINIAAKYKYMYGGHFEVPFLTRMIIGRSWGQGAQHSQSLQSLFAHIPGLVVIMPSSADAVLESYHHAVANYRGPVISIEHRLLYDFTFKSTYEYGATAQHDPFSSRIVRSGKDITVVATSIMVIEAQRIADYLAKEFAIGCEIIDLHSVSHYDKDMILRSVRKTGKLLVADTSWQAYGVSAEISRVVCESDPSMLKAPVISLGMQPSPCPTSKHLEDLFYPDDLSFTEKIIELVKGKNHGLQLPGRSLNEVYKKFKGPF
ncbi:MAG TPA: transketolase C-terminal domain-containing protein [Chitinophagaceae bacterium]|jgi:pyruvate dehydrogenase E1 component beta subunit